MKNKWIIQVFILSFILSALFSGLSSYLSNLNIILLTIVLILVILIGILFDMIGVATLTALEAPFHARNSKKIKEAQACIKLLKNSTKVSSVCNDIIGDICGIISGSLGASLAVYLITLGMNPLLATILITSFISSLTVGGKALCKNIATKKSDSIVLITGKILNIFHC